MNPELPENRNQDNQFEKQNEINSPQSINEPEKPRKSLLKKIIIIISLSILGLLTLAILAFFVQSYLRKQEISKQTKAAPQKIANSRSSTEQTADKKLEQITSLITQAGITDKQIASSKIDVCYVTHADQGWFAYTYYQDCYLRYVQGYTTKLSKDELKRKLLAQPEAQNLFNKENSNPTAAFEDCELYQKAFTDTTNKGELIYRPANVTNDEYSCKVPNPLQGLFSVKGPIILDNELATKTYRTFDATKIDNSTNQFWFSFDEYYYHEGLGCSAGGIFCDNPRPKPIQAP